MVKHSGTTKYVYADANSASFAESSNDLSSTTEGAVAKTILAVAKDSYAMYNDEQPSGELAQARHRVRVLPSLTEATHHCIRQHWLRRSIRTCGSVQGRVRYLQRCIASRLRIVFRCGCPCRGLYPLSRWVFLWP